MPAQKDARQSQESLRQKSSHQESLEQATLGKKRAGKKFLSATNTTATNTTLQQELLAWFDHHKRDLPWRHNKDPYRVLLSEVLLQQTQVVRGIHFFELFLARFPTIEDLAKANLPDVLHAWQGAGYYARARNLHRAAQHIATHGTPSTPEGWLALPGVGRYTANAVASIAQGAPVAVVDGNVRRVLARLFLEMRPSDAWLWETAQRALYTQRPGDWNEAIMELGATICTPKAPRCEHCPIATHCAALRSANVAAIPAPKTKANIKTIRAVALVAHHNDHVILEERPARGLLGGLYGVPLSEGNTTEALPTLLQRLGLQGHPEFLGRITHQMTHRHWHVDVYQLPIGKHAQLVQPKDKALSRLDEKILATLQRTELGM